MKATASAWVPGVEGTYWEPMPDRPRLPSVEACEREDWTQVVWPKSSTIDLATGEIFSPDGEPVRRPFLCGSWRCRRCARWRGASDFVRMREGLLARPWWLYCVLTFDPGQLGCQEAYVQAGRMWDEHLRQSLRRQGGAYGYAQTWERHENGYPHCNLLMSGDTLREWVEGMGVKERWRTSPHSGRVRRCLLPRGWRQWFRSAAMRAGFGRVVWAELLTPEHPEALAAYFVKLCKELTGAPGGSKGNQSPINAPPGFRRLRASRGLLPRSALRPDAEGDWTGGITCRKSRELHGRREPGHPVPFEPSNWEHVAEIIRDRERQAWLKSEPWPEIEEIAEQGDDDVPQWPGELDSSW